MDATHVNYCFHVHAQEYFLAVIELKIPRCLRMARSAELRRRDTFPSISLILLESGDSLCLFSCKADEETTLQAKEQTPLIP